MNIQHYYIVGLLSHNKKKYVGVKGVVAGTVNLQKRLHIKVYLSLLRLGVVPKEAPSTQ